VKTKRCPKCGNTKPFSEFYKSKACKNVLSSWCKVCHVQYTNRHQKLNRRRYNEYSKKWVLNNPEKRKASSQKYRENNSEKGKKYSKKYRIEHPHSTTIWMLKNPDKARALRKRRRIKECSTAKGMLDRRMGCGIFQSLHGNKFGRKWETLVGYSVGELHAHLESLFTDGMTWDAFMHGEIHVDHIAPKSRFKYETAEDPEFKVCWSLANLQPMWAKDNLCKYAKTPEEWEQYKLKAKTA